MGLNAVPKSKESRVVGEFSLEARRLNHPSPDITRASMAAALSLPSASFAHLVDC